MIRRRLLVVGGFCAFVLFVPASFAMAQASAPAQGPVVTDITTIDPHTLKAMAARLPDGRAPKIDGRLDDAEWALAPVQGRFVQREPQFGWESTERTEFRILYDDKTLYFGVWAYDSDADGIIASDLKRDSGLRKGDQLKIVLDTFHDHRNAFLVAERTTTPPARPASTSCSGISIGPAAIFTSSTTRGGRPTRQAPAICARADGHSRSRLHTGGRDEVANTV